MKKFKRIAIVAHDEMKPAMLEWVKFNEVRLSHHKLWATGTTGLLIMSECPTLKITPLKSGPLGGDQQIGAMIAEGRVDILFFFTDPLTSQPHDVDVKALSRLASVYNIPMACNRSTADYLISSPLFEGYYIPDVKDFTSYNNRFTKK